MKDLDKLFRELQQQKLQAVTRRHFLKDCVAGVGSIALASFWQVVEETPVDLEL